MTVITADKAIIAGRQFLLQPGRLSGFFRPQSTDVILQNIDLKEKIEVVGYYSNAFGDPFLPIKVQKQEVTAWNVTFKVRSSSGKTTLQIFYIPESENPVVNVIEDSIDLNFLYCFLP